MRKFKNPEAQEMWDEAEALERTANEKIEESGFFHDVYGEWLTMAATMRFEAEILEEEYQEDRER